MPSKRNPSPAVDARRRASSRPQPVLQSQANQAARQKDKFVSLAGPGDEAPPADGQSASAPGPSSLPGELPPLPQRRAPSGLLLPAAVPTLFEDLEEPIAKVGVCLCMCELCLSCMCSSKECELYV